MPSPLSLSIPLSPLPYISISFHGHFNCHKNFQYHCCDLILSPSPLSLLFPPSHLVSTTLSLLMPLVTWLSFVFVITYIFKYLKFNCHSHCHPISTDNILCNLITNIITIAIAVFTPSNSKVVVITNLNFISIIPFQFLSSLPKNIVLLSPSSHPKFVSIVINPYCSWTFCMIAINIHLFSPIFICTSQWPLWTKASLVLPLMQPLLNWPSPINLHVFTKKMN